MAAPAIGKRKRWVPPTRAKLDEAHPLTSGLISMWWPGLVKDVVDGKVWTKTALATGYVSTPYGKGMSASSTSTAAWTRIDPFPSDRSDGAIMIIQKTLSLAGDGCCVGVATTNPYRWGAHAPYSPGGIDFDCGNEASHRLSFAGFTWGNWNTIALTNGPTNGQCIWIDGLRKATTSYSTDAHVNSGTIYGWGVHDSIRSQQNEVAVIAAWNREPSPAEVAQFHGDPFCMLKY